MSGSSLRGPARRGAAEIDEGALTRAVVARLSREDGSRGQQAALAVIPARQALWEAAVKNIPQRLAQCLQERTYDGDQTGRGGILELRRILVDWLLDTPPCRRCHRPMQDSPRWCFRTEGARRRRRCEPYTRHRATGLPPALFRGFVAVQMACQIDGPYQIVCDRDARALLAATDLRQPGLPPEVQRARKELDRLLEDAVSANGRLVLKTQLKYYSPNGSITRADLLQGGMIGCRRALLDYDPLKASFATYSIPWIRQGLGEVFSDRDLVGTPEDVLSRGRRLEGLGIVNADALSAMRGVADFRGRESSEDFGEAVDLLCRALHLEDFEMAVAELREVLRGGPKTQTRDRTLERVASWAAGKLDQKIQEMEAAKAQASPKKGKSKGKKPPPHSPPKRTPTTASALLTTLRHGAPVVSPTGEAATEEAPDTTVVVGRDLFAEIEELEDHSEQAQRFHKALSKVRFEDPEAAEVLLRHHGLDGMETETLDEIASRPLGSSGRKLCRESIRQLGERGEGRLAAHLRALVELEEDEFDDKDPYDEGWDPNLTLQPKNVITMVAPPRAEIPIVTAEELEDQPPSFLVF